VVVTKSRKLNEPWNAFEFDELEPDAHWPKKTAEPAECLG